jgi:AbrB family looped-hinge helix DNA binding protein
VQTKVSSKGQVVLPLASRTELRIEEGDQLAVRIENGELILTPPKRRKFKTWVESSPTTGLPVIVSEPDAPTMTGEWVRKQLEDFP